MKKNLLLGFFILITAFASAKKVKFAVDMSTFTISPLGIHVMGDFQDEAGFPLGDWTPNTTTMTQQGVSTIYSVVVDIPAFRAYEYKFVNGDQTYEAEFVPDMVRPVPYGVTDNRWLFVDSIANDTTYIGAIVFGATSPAGLKMMRYMVDMSGMTVPLTGVHLAGTFQGWDPAKIRMHTFGSNVYDIITYTTNASYEYKFYNGNTLGTSETVPSGCAVNNNRGLSFTQDTIMNTVCFSSCTNTCASGIKEAAASLSGVKLYPNPATSFSTLELNENKDYVVSLTDYTGRKVRNYTFTGVSLQINREDLAPGIYFATVSDKANATTTLKLVIQ